jgi:hypothetical protein
LFFTTGKFLLFLLSFLLLLDHGSFFFIFHT